GVGGGQRRDHGESAGGWVPRSGERYHATRPGDPEPEAAAQRHLRQAYRPAAKEDRGRLRARYVPDRGNGQGIWPNRQGDRKTARATRPKNRTRPQGTH